MGPFSKRLLIKTDILCNPACLNGYLEWKRDHKLWTIIKNIVSEWMPCASVWVQIWLGHTVRMASGLETSLAWLYHYPVSARAHIIRDPNVLEPLVGRVSVSWWVNKITFKSGGWDGGGIEIKWKITRCWTLIGNTQLCLDFESRLSVWKEKGKSQRVFNKCLLRKMAFWLKPRNNVLQCTTLVSELGNRLQ